jgi:NAD(P)-dependent dehydrogenase (short-subunit alcohol dehydrogenase family)
MPRLADKLCLVTGAARGIGLAIAQAFHAQGAQVIITDIDAEEGQAAADALGCRFITLDVSDEAAWDALEREVPHVDVLVNNAGITGLGDHRHKHDPENTPLSEWRRVHEINLDGTFLGCRYAIRAMKASGKGSIINMSSRSGLSAFRGCGLCLIQGGDPQPYQIGGALLRGARLGDPVQFDPPRRDPDADLNR